MAVLLPFGYAQSPSLPSAKDAAQAARTIPFEKPSFEQRRTLVSIPSGGCTTLSIRALDSESTAILVQGPQPVPATGENPAHFREERIVTCTWDNKPPHVLERDRTGTFPQWNACLLSWEPGGRSLLIAAEFDGRTKWFRVDPFDQSGRYTFQNPVIEDYCDHCDPAKWAMEPRYTIQGTMRPVPSRQTPMREDDRETGRATFLDIPRSVGGLTGPFGDEDSTAFVNQKSGMLTIFTGETIHFANKVNAAIIDLVLLFNWNGRALAATWTTERYGDLLIPGVPGAFRTIDLGPDTVKVKPIARLATGVAILVDDGKKTELVQVHP